MVEFSIRKGETLVVLRFIFDDLSEVAVRIPTEEYKQVKEKWDKFG